MSEFVSLPITSQSFTIIASDSNRLIFEGFLTSFLPLTGEVSEWILWYNIFDKWQECSNTSFWVWHKISSLHLKQLIRVGLFLCIVEFKCWIIHDFFNVWSYDGTVFEHTKHWNNSASEFWVSRVGVLFVIYQTTKNDCEIYFAT